MYAIILNYESGEVEVLDLRNKPEDLEIEDYIEDVLDYNLSNTDWMITKKIPEINILN